MNKENNYIKIFDTTLRDGEQSPGASMNIEEKLKIAEALEDLKVDIIEAGFPAASKGDYEARLLYTSPSPRDQVVSRMPSSA